MKLNPGLDAALQVYRDLGWSGAEPEDALTLPLGTPEQQRVAKAGLASGDWGEVGQIAERRYGWISAVSEAEDLLALFAVRVGVDAARAAAVLRITEQVPEHVVTAVLASRGPDFVSRFITAACVPSRRWSEWSPTAHGGSVVRLVADLGLPVPDNAEYLKDWSAHAADALVDSSYVDLHRREPVPESVIRDRFAEHVEAGVALGVGATASFGVAMSQGAVRGWLPRERAVELALLGLDAAQRPGDRKAWTGILVDDLGLTDVEAVARLELLIPVLATGESATTGRFAPALVAGAPPERLVEVVTAALTTTTAKVRRGILTALAGREVPAEVGTELAPLVQELTTVRDRSVVVAAERLLARWSEFGAEETGEPAAFPGSTNAAQTETGASPWQPTPPVWSAPAFDAGPATPEALTALAADLMGRRDGVVDVTVEQFLATANAVARRDPGAARQALAGVRESQIPGLRAVAQWRRDPTASLRSPNTGLLTHRETAVFQRLGKVPAVLSTPSRVDLSVTLPDLVARLEAYAAAEVAVDETDLLLALTRLDPATWGDADALLGGVEKTRIPVIRLDGSPLGGHAVAYVRHWLAGPVTEPPLVVGDYQRWEPARLAVPAALGEFSHWLAMGSWDDLSPAVFPFWGDTACRQLGFSGWDVQRYLGVLARQVARRATPLPPGAAVNLLGCQRTPTPDVAADLYDAVQEAWERGLLRPGVADVAFLDWSTTPSNLAAFASAMLDLVPTGALPAIWPVLDDLVRLAISGRRMTAGTIELVDAVATLLPDVVAAVGEGRAPSDVLDLPGIRALAERSGSSAAVKTARQIVAQLPEVASPATPAAAPAEQEPVVLDPPFEEIWSAGAGEQGALPDGALVTVSSHPRATGMLAFDLELPGEPEWRYQVVKGWTHDLTSEVQCAAARHAPGEAASGARDAWLRWDAAAGALVVSAHRNWASNGDGALPASARSDRLSDALVVVALGLMTQGGDEAFLGRRVVGTLVRDNRFGAASVRSAVRVLLSQPDVMPGRLVRVIEENPTTLPTLWPILAELLACAADEKSLPRWLNQVLDATLVQAAYLAEATRRGILPADTWAPVAAIASRSGKSAALVKARELGVILGVATSS